MIGAVKPTWSKAIMESDAIEEFDDLLPPSLTIDAIRKWNAGVSLRLVLSID